MPVVTSTAGYFTPSAMWWYGLIARERTKARLGLGRAHLGLVELAVRLERRPHGVGYRDLVDGRTEEFRALGDRAAHEDAALAAALDRELAWRRVAVCDEPLGARDRVAPGVGLRLPIARLVPLLAVLAAAPDVRDGEHAAAFEPGEVLRAEKRRLRNSIGPVAIEDRRRRAVELQPFAVNDRQRHERAVVRLRLHFQRDQVARVVVSTLRLQLRVGRAPDGRIVGVIAAEARPGPGVEHDTGLPGIGDERIDVARERQLDRGGARARCVLEAEEVAHARRHPAHVERVLARGNTGDHGGALRHDDRSRREAGIGEIDAQHLEMRRVPVREQIQRAADQCCIGHFVVEAGDARPPAERLAAAMPRVRRRWRTRAGCRCRRFRSRTRRRGPSPRSESPTGPTRCRG